MRLAKICESSVAAVGIVAAAPWWYWSNDWGTLPKAGAAAVVLTSLVVIGLAPYRSLDLSRPARQHAARPSRVGALAAKAIS